mgnify:CR=1 FL=1
MLVLAWKEEENNLKIRWSKEWMSMKINDNRNLDIELKCGLEEYLMEDIDRQLEGFRNLDEPPYSEEYKKFVQNFFKRK